MREFVHLDDMFVMFRTACCANDRQNQTPLKLKTVVDVAREGEGTEVFKNLRLRVRNCPLENQRDG